LSGPHKATKADLAAALLQWVCRAVLTVSLIC
jgi:hypothetical protein